MKKIVCVVLVLMISIFVFCGCGAASGVAQKSVDDTQHQILLNNGSCFVFTFKDNETGVWYISTSEGITPRLNADGSLYVTGY